MSMHTTDLRCFSDHGFEKCALQICDNRGWLLSPPMISCLERGNIFLPPTAALVSVFKKQRGEKKPVPNEQKDDRYFERRRRNNYAAKKSRDARKLRDDQIALKAAILEQENAILRAQLVTLRNEASAMRRLLLDRSLAQPHSTQNSSMF